MVRSINEAGIEPDVFTLATDASIDKWRESRPPEEGMRFRIVRPLTVPFARGYVYQTVLHNWMSRGRLADYDLIINSNDFLGFLPTSVRRLHYVHFPLSQVFAQTERYQKLRWQLASAPVRLITSQLEGSVIPGDIVCTNSAFSARFVARQWPGVAAEVLPPPVTMPEAPDVRRPRDIDVVTLGAIVSDKGQMEQVQIASRLRNYRFVMIGYVASPRYYDQVMQAIRDLGLTNVQVISDASQETVHDCLSRARVFLHTKRDEHFGIGIAEAIGRGCIPVIHDSGGQTEIVADPRLRYQDEDEAVRVLTKLLEGSSYPEEELTALREHVRSFRPEAFRARFALLLQRALRAEAKRSHRIT